MWTTGVQGFDTLPYSDDIAIKELTSSHNIWEARTRVQLGLWMGRTMATRPIIGWDNNPYYYVFMFIIAFMIIFIIIVCFNVLLLSLLSLLLSLSVSWLLLLLPFILLLPYTHFLSGAAPPSI